MSKHIEDYYNIKQTQEENVSISKRSVNDTENFNPHFAKEEEDAEENSEFTDKMLHEIISSLDENSNSFLSRRSVASIYTEKNYLYDEEDIDMKGQNEQKGCEQKEMEGEEGIDNNNIDEEAVEKEEERRNSSFRERVIQMNEGLNEHVLNSGSNVGSDEFDEKGSKETGSKEVSPRQLQEESVFPEEDRQFIHKAGTIREICNTLKEEVVEEEEASEGERKWEEEKSLEKKQILKTDSKWTAQNLRRRHSMKRSGVTDRNENVRKVHSFRIAEEISKEKTEFLKYSRNREELEALKEKNKMKEKVQNSERKTQKEIKYIYKSYSPAPIPQTEKTGFWFIDTINSLLDKYCDINEKDHYLNNMDIIEIYPNDEAQYTRINDTLKIKWPDFLKWDYIIYHTHILKIYEKIFKKFHKDVKSINSLTQHSQERLSKSKEIPLPKFFHKNVKDRCILKCYEHLPELKITENQCNSLCDNKEKNFRNVWKNSANRVEKTFAFFFDKFSEKIINMGSNINVVDSLKEGTKSVVSNVQNSHIFARFPKVLNSFFENMFSCLKYEKGDEEEIGEVVMDNFPMESSMANSEVCPYYDNMNLGTPYKSNNHQ